MKVVYIKKIKSLTVIISVIFTVMSSNFLQIVGNNVELQSYWLATEGLGAP